MLQFKEIFDQYSWDEVYASIYAKKASDVERALSKDNLDLEDFKALISPAAAPYLPVMAERSHQRTLQRFGKTMQMYVPLYLSNECQNICTYCGFSMDNKLRRKTLNDEEIIREAKAIKEMGFDHVLLVTGEANQLVGVPYLKHAIEILRPYFAQISIEVQPLDEDEYKTHHPKGKKSNFYYRLDTPDRAARAGVDKIGLGVLIGLEDWRVDSFFTALHLNYLEKQYWQTKYSLSFPRLRPYVGNTEPKVIMNDRELVQLICAYRLFDQELELSISTRETEAFRNHIIKLGITSMSSGSKTNPGGYVVEKESLEQFEISDERTPQEIADMLKGAGYEPVWKDWAQAYDV